MKELSERDFQEMLSQIARTRQVKIQILTEAMCLLAGRPSFVRVDTGKAMGFFPLAAILVDLPEYEAKGFLLKTMGEFWGEKINSMALTFLEEEIGNEINSSDSQ